MKTAGTLNDRSKKELADLAKRRGVRGWEGMDKTALIKALSKKPDAAVKAAAKPAKQPVKVAKVAAKVTKAKTTPPKHKVRPASKPVGVGPKVVTKTVAKPVTKSSPVPKPAPAKTKPTPTVALTPKSGVAGANGVKPTANGSHKPNPPAVTKSLIQKVAVPAKTATKSLIPTRDTSRDTGRHANAVAKDRIFLTVPNPFWLNAYWELTSHSMQRAEAALRQDWHGAKLIIRLFDVTSGDTTSTSETPVKDVTIQGTGQTWYIDVPGGGRAYRADIGYVSRRGDFYVLARSNVVTPPKAGTGEAGEGFDVGGWDDDDAKRKAERILAMSTGFESSGSSELRELYEERLGRPLGPPKQTAFGTGAIPPGSVKKFFFEIDAKLIVFGRTDPSAHLTLNNDPIKLSPDGTFRMTFNLPDSRQIIPAVAASADGVEERTIVLAVERNTKHLDPMIHDQMNEV